MNIVIAGPAHSGKSVLISNLERLLPCEAYLTRRLNPDGEGAWSNNPDQKQVQQIRRKEPYDQSLIIKEANKLVERNGDIVLVDIGGMIQEDKVPVFSHCSYFIILCKKDEKEEIEKWRRFGIDNGSICLAQIISDLEAAEDSFDYKDGVLYGTLKGLSRGNDITSSPLLMALADDLIIKSGYKRTVNKEEDTVNFLDFASFVGKARTVNGQQITYDVKTDSSFALRLRDYLKKLPQRNGWKLNGFRANWLCSSACDVLKDCGVKNIFLYDAVSKSYVSLVKLEKEKDITQSKDLGYSVKEGANSVLLHIAVKEGKTLDSADLASIRIPIIDENKTLYISGRIPLWLLCSITISLDNREVFILQPGKGFVSSRSEREAAGKERKFEEIQDIDMEAFFTR